MNWIVLNVPLADWYNISVHSVCFVKEDVLAPPPENDDVVNDFDIEEEVIEVENRSDICVCVCMEARQNL